MTQTRNVEVSVDEAGIRALYGSLLEAWNRRDPHAFAALFARDGQTVGFDGSQMTGDETEDQLRSIFESHPTASYVAKVRGVRSLGPVAAVLRAIAGMVPPDQVKLNPDVNAVQSLVAEQHEGRWRVVLFQNTPAQYHGRPDLAEQHTRELQQILDAQP